MLRHLDPRRVSCLVAASIRPQYLAPLRKVAEELGAPLIIQPRSVHPAYAAFLRSFQETRSDAVLCYSYSMILRREVLDMVGGAAVNLHASLLPLNRGPNPIQWALIHDDPTTGVSLHLMAEEVDAGDILGQRSIPIGDDDTWLTLRDRLGLEAEILLHETLSRLLEGDWSAVPQDPGRARRNHRLTPDCPRIDFARMTDRAVFNLIRAQVKPLGGAYLQGDEGRLAFDEWMSLDEVAGLRRRHEGRVPTTTSSGVEGARAGLTP